MNFGIDFDDTITAEALIISKFISDLQQGGHKVFCVTARNDNEENRKDVETYLRLYGIDILTIYCSHKPKQKVVNNRGIKIDIWMDNDPISIVEV